CTDIPALRSRRYITTRYLLSLALSFLGVLVRFFGLDVPNASATSFRIILLALAATIAAALASRLNS
ncbi:uncharacterized protein BCR38DRAFT_438258, partial [Pseudomassariella vexata]